MQTCARAAVIYSQGARLNLNNPKENHIDGEKAQQGTGDTEK